MIPKFYFHELTLREQVDYTYTWFRENTISYAGYEADLPEDLRNLNKDFYKAVQEHFKSKSTNKHPGNPILIKHKVLKFLRQNEIESIEELKGPLLTLMKIQVLK